ncbi:EEF1A lysine methyltransferase 4-like [Zingiber officinale]|uniref:EEF1A lysine methyltransferase 4-like n=1 Tax=Zingiber officinale TaxID=94328 RepID=UPI001C4B634E|nr:EEF1A lysine methyltransferase 4-like [Zingiber officinale]
MFVGSASSLEVLGTEGETRSLAASSIDQRTFEYLVNTEDISAHPSSGTSRLAVIHGNWNPHPETLNKVMKMLEGARSLLKPEGIFISISFRQPHFRGRYLKEPALLEWKTFEEGFHYFFCILRKGRRTLKSDDSENERLSDPSINLLHEELEDENYMFHSTLCKELEN